MQWTGNIGRTVGQVVLALGIMSFVLGVTGLLVGAWLVDSATEQPGAAEEVGDMLSLVVPWSVVFLAVGVLGVASGIVVLGAARAVRERGQRSAGRPATQATSVEAASPRTP